MLRHIFIAAALASSAAAAIAAPTYIHAGRLIAVPGKAPLGPSTVIVDNGRIVEVRDGHQPPPAGASAIDLRDRTVLREVVEAVREGVPLPASDLVREVDRLVDALDGGA